MVHPNSTRQIEMVGHFSGQLGVGEVARRLATLLRLNGHFLHQCDFRLDRSASIEYQLDKIPFSELDPACLVTCVNPDLTALAFLGQHPRSLFKKGISHVGFWSWELENFPQIFKPAVSLVDEIWTVSEFAARSISLAFPLVKVSSIKLPVPFPKNSSKEGSSTDLKNDNKFRVLISLDAQSGVERKNPLDAAKAYLQAFRPDDGAELVIKVSNSKAHEPALIEMANLVEKRTDVKIMNKNIPKSQYETLIRSSGVFLSLHRAEGFGLNLIDAMSRGSVVVGTGYSGNMDYMNDMNSIPISYELTSISEYANIKIESQWATPNVLEASEQMRDLYLNAERRKYISENAKHYVESNYSEKAAAEAFCLQFPNEAGRLNRA